MVMLLKRNLHYLTVILLTGYLSALNGITRDRHYHVLPNGEVIQHIHPVNKNTPQPYGNHTHSPNEFNDLPFKIFDSQEPSTNQVNVEAEFLYFDIEYCYSPPFRNKIPHNTKSLRAPPVEKVT
jgi:hypothetical protein